MQEKEGKKEKPYKQNGKTQKKGTNQNKELKRREK